MSATTLAAAAIVDTAATALLLYVGWAIRQRHASPEGKRALDAFAIWWAGLAVNVGVNALKEALAAAGLDAAPAVIAFLNVVQYVWVIALCASVWGLLYYLVYLYTGNERWRARLAAFYALYAVLALWVIWRMGPAGVTPTPWFVQWAYAEPSAGGALLVVLSLLLLLPQIVAAAVYLRVASKTEDALARRRIRLVSWSLILWLGISLAAPFLQLGRYEVWQAGGRLVGLVAAIVILAAYQAPAWLRPRTQEGRA